MDFFGEKLNSLKIVEGSNFAEECISSDIVSWRCLFHLNCEVFLAKKPNENLNLEK